MRYRTTIIILLVLPFLGVSQPRQLKKSDTEYDRLAYMDAQQMYLKIVKNGYESQELYQNLGDTYYYNNDYVNANRWYAKAFEYDKSTITKEYYFKYIQTLKSSGKYDKIEDIMEFYVQTHGVDQYIENYRANKDYMRKIAVQSDRYTIKNLKMNSPSQDFGVSLIDDGQKVLFSSSQDSSFMVQFVNKWTNREFLNIYSADVDTTTAELSNIEKLGAGINTRFHESNAIYTNDGKTVYFTRNNFLRNRFRTSSDNINKLKIYRATRKSQDASWGEIEELSINGNEFSTAHPALNKEESRLYFASDRPGSKSSLKGDRLSDIWYVDIDSDGSLGNPVNLEAINTHGNEMFPYVGESGSLYFASTGHQGLGGLDVFMVELENGEPAGEVINLGTPINSPQDDFALVINSKGKGYFSSNRESGKGLDDIYSFTENKPVVCETEIAGVVRSKLSNETLEGSTVYFVDEDNKVLSQTQVGPDGAYLFYGECNRNYTVKGELETYDPAEAYVQTLAVKDEPYRANLFLSKSIKDKIDNIQVGDDLAKALNINMIYFDFDKSNIREDAEIELQKVLLFMETYPTVKIDIRSHTDSRANDAYNVKLSDRRAKSTRAYLIMKGISPDRLTAKGYGESMLVNECSNGVSCTPEQHQLNRRSEFIIVAK